MSRRFIRAGPAFKTGQFERLLAMPEFVKMAKNGPENLVYEWSNGVDVYQSQNGYGKSVLILNGLNIGSDGQKKKFWLLTPLIIW